MSTHYCLIFGIIIFDAMLPLHIFCLVIFLTCYKIKKREKLGKNDHFRYEVLRLKWQKKQRIISEEGIASSEVSIRLQFSQLLNFSRTGRM